MEGLKSKVQGSSATLAAKWLPSLVAIIYFTYNVLAVYIGEQSNVAYISHIIGFLIGIPFGAAWSKNFAKNLLITIILFLIYLAIVIFLIPLILPAQA